MKDFSFIGDKPTVFENIVTTFQRDSRRPILANHMSFLGPVDGVPLHDILPMTQYLLQFPSAMSYMPLESDMIDLLEFRSGLNDGAVTRAGTTRTRVNPDSGLIETMGANVAVFEAEGLSYNPAAENLCFPSEPTVAQLSYSEGSRSNAVGFNAFERSVEIAADGVATAAYMSHGNLSASVGETRAFSFYVEMLDELGVPVLTQTTDAASDFTAGVQNFASGATIRRIQHITGKIYRIHCTRVLTDGTGVNWGIYRYAANRPRHFRVSGFQFENAPACNAYIKTTSAAVSTARDAYAWTLSAQLKNILSDAEGAATSEGTLIVDFVPGYSSAMKPTAGGASRLFLGSTTLLFDQFTETRFGIGDGTIWPTVDMAHSAGDVLRFAVRFGEEVLGVAKFNFGIKKASSWVWSAASNYDGSFDVTTQLLVGHNNTYPFHLKNMRFFTAPCLTQAQIEANF